MVEGMTTRTITPAIAALAADITDVVRRDAGLAAIDTARDVAAALRRSLRTPDLLAAGHQVSRADCYCQHVLYVDPDGAFSIVALVWLPGQRTPIHDHVTWCVVGVYAGAEEETLYRLVEPTAGSAGTSSAAGTSRPGGPYLVPAGHSVNRVGETSYFAPPGDIHEVCNSSNGKVISIHVYGTDVSVCGTSIRRRYDLPVVSAD
jgi:predicted metal-dependent enzyme (double-stranded beta helix superfamily)